MLLAELKNVPPKKVAQGTATVWVVVHTADRMILGKRASTNNNPNQWNFFGGRIDKGETPVEAAVRELEEETGHKTSAGSLKELVKINDATYFSLEVQDASAIKTSSEISKVTAFKVVDLPNNLHSKTSRFFDKVDWLLR